MNNTICVNKNNPTEYFIKEKDTFFTISKSHNILMDDLQRANKDIDPEYLIVGNKMDIPSHKNNDNNLLVYKVKERDTFYSIARENKVSLDALYNTNRNINPDKLHTGQTLYIPKIWNQYKSSSFLLTFSYPILWKRISESHYKGINGFFELSTIETEQNLEQVCKSEAIHKLMPYGSNPNISEFKLCNQRAFLITPSNDQICDMNNQSAFIVKYPEVLQERYNYTKYLLLKCDYFHIKDIISTFLFTI